MELPNYDFANILGLRKERVVTMDSQASIYNEDQGSLSTTKTNLMSSLPNCMLGFTNLDVSKNFFQTQHIQN